MVTFTKLFEIRIVANKRSESSNKAMIRLSDECSSSSISLRSPGEREKNAISEADTKPDANKTKEAIFAYQCDKLECDLQAKLYDEEGCVDLNHQEGNKIFNNSEVQKLLHHEKSWGKMWLSFSQNRYNYDKNFTSVSNYAKENSIKKLINK